MAHERSHDAVVLNIPATPESETKKLRSTAAQHNDGMEL